MQRSIALCIILSAIVGAALACNAPGAAPTADLAAIVAATQTAIAVAGSLATPTSSAGLAATPVSGPQTAVATVPGTLESTPYLSPPARPTPDCNLSAKFISETVPDNTQFLPNQPFIKTWTLQNVGTCTWTPEYKLVFSSGEQMGGTSPAPIGQTVPPEGTIQLFLPQTAPSASGEHQGSWMLEDLYGNRFSLGEDSKTPVWVKIIVSGSASTPTAGAPASIPNLGPPTTTYTFSGNSAPFYLGESEGTVFEIKNNTLVITAVEPSGDLWRVAERSGVDNFVIESRFRTGAACSGRDGYGLLLRAPNQSDNIIDSGYVFGFNCDGQYRVYRMDNGVYSAIQNWTSNPSLRPGPNQENVMMVRGEGDRFQFYGNGTLLFEFFDPTYSAGLWGLMVGSGGTPNFQVAVSQISIWDLP